MAALRERGQWEEDRLHSRVESNEQTQQNRSRPMEKRLTAVEEGLLKKLEGLGNLAP